MDWGDRDMSKALKWGMVIAICMLIFCTIYIFRNQIGVFLYDFLNPLYIGQEIEDPFSKSMEMWETEIHSADADENKGVE